MVPEETLESPLDSKEIQPLNPKGNQARIFIGGTDVEAQISILWPPDPKNWLIWKDPDAAKDWGQEEKGVTEDEMPAVHGVTKHQIWQSDRVHRHTSVCVYKYIKPNHFGLYLKLTNIFSQLWKLKVMSLSRIQLFAAPWTVAHQAPPSLGFSRQEHWSGLPFNLQCMKVKSESEVSQSCPTLCDPMDCSPPGFSVHGILQARVLEWGCHCLLQGIFPTQGSNPGLPHWRQML